MEDERKKAGRKKEGATRGRGSPVDSSGTNRKSIADKEIQGTWIPGPNSYDQSVGEFGIRGQSENYPDGGSLGEVLEHLANLESRFYTYVHAHQERLDERKKESSRAEQEFAAEALELKAKILDLITDGDLSSIKKED